MATQTLTFVCCPNNLGTPACSVSPSTSRRGWTGATLAAFPDVLNWTQRVKSAGLKFQVRCGRA